MNTSNKHQIIFRDSKKSMFDNTNQVVLEKLTISEAEAYAFNNDLFIVLVDGRPNPYYRF